MGEADNSRSKIICFRLMCGGVSMIGGQCSIWSFRNELDNIFVLTEPVELVGNNAKAKQRAEAKTCLVFQNHGAKSAENGYWAMRSPVKQES